MYITGLFQDNDQARGVGEGGSHNKLWYWKRAAYKQHTLLHVMYGGADTCGIVGAYIIKGVWGHAPPGNIGVFKVISGGT